MTNKVCAMAGCDNEFPVSSQHPNQMYCSIQCVADAKKAQNAKRDKKPSIVNARYKARGIVQDNVHPNERGADMSQYVGTFRIEDDGKVVTR